MYMFEIADLNESVKRAIANKDENSLENCEHDFAKRDNGLITCRKCHLTFLNKEEDEIIIQESENKDTKRLVRKL